MSWCYPSRVLVLVARLHSNYVGHPICLGPILFVCGEVHSTVGQIENRIERVYGVKPQLLYEQLRHLDTRHFVIIECRNLAKGCGLKCGCIGRVLFRNLSCLGTIICSINTIGIVPAYACTVCDAMVASYATTD